LYCGLPLTVVPWAGPLSRGRTSGGPGPVPTPSNNLARIPHPGDGVTDRQRVALRRQDLDQRPGQVGLVDHVGLVGLDLDQLLTDGHLVAHPLQPLEDGALLHRVGQPGHDDLLRHQRLPSNVCSAALMMWSPCGIAACSIRFEYGMWTSAPVTRSTG